MRKRLPGQLDNTGEAMKDRPVSVALVGIYPPPFGGIAIHVQRLHDQLASRGFRVKVYNLEGRGEDATKNVFLVKDIKRWLPGYLLRSDDRIVHYHMSNWFLRVCFATSGVLGRKTVISIHNQRLCDTFSREPFLKRALIAFGFRRASYVICDNDNIRTLIAGMGVCPDRIGIIPPFIPPVCREDDVQKVPAYVREFIERHKPVITGNAFQISFYEGVDLYGLDMCVELIARLKEYHPNVGLVFCLPNIGDPSYYTEIQKRISQKGLEDNVLFITEPLDEVYVLWMRSDVFVRPTCTDGDSLSLREALYFRVPSVSSDAAPRPEGTIVFRNRDMDDFSDKVIDILNNYNAYKDRLNELKVENGLERIIGVYNEVAK